MGVGTIDIGSGYIARPADDYGEFAKFSRLYRGLPAAFSTGHGAYCENAPCVFIEKNGRRAAGCLFSENALGHLFLIPPFAERADLISALAKYNSGNGRVYALEVNLDELQDYFAAGFRVCTETEGGGAAENYCPGFMSEMVRPCEKLEYKLPDGVGATGADARKTAAIARFLYECYGGGDPGRDRLADFQDSSSMFFGNADSYYRAASSLLFRNGDLVGCCLVLKHDGLPLIYDLAVKRGERGNGLARCMIARAVGKLADKNDYIRLFVEQGNPVQALYRDMGFLSGPVMATLYRD